MFDLLLHTRSIARRSLALFAGSVLAATAAAQSSNPIDPRVAVDPRLYAGLTWRNLGPFRAGRVAAVSAPVGGSGVFYIGLPAGGVWKTTSAGQTWYPIFDDDKEVSSIGSIEVAPSDPNVIYVGTGDIITGGGINEGNGIYKSTDAGKTWRHLGLDATKQIPTILVDPKDPSVVLIGAQGNAHAKGRDRGVFRSTDGGATWTQTLFVDDSTTDHDPQAAELALERTLRFLAELGCGRIEVTSASHREEAHRFYRERGYAQQGVKFIREIPGEEP